MLNECSGLRSYGGVPVKRLLFTSLLLCIVASSLFLLLAPRAAAQLTTVTGTVKDVNGIGYSGARVTAQLVFAGTPVSSPTVTISVLAQCQANGFGSAPCQVPFSPNQGPFFLDNGGNIPGGGITLQDNSLVQPGSTQWRFTANENGTPPPLGTGPQTCSASLTISGATQSVSTSFSACPALSNASGGGNPSSAGMIDPTATPYSAKIGAKEGNDGSTISSQPTFSSVNQTCVAGDATNLAIAVNTASGAYPYGTGLITVLSCSGGSWTLSGNANATLSNVEWAIGPDANPIGNPALSNAYAAAITQGKMLAIPCSAMIVSTSPFIATASLMDYVISTYDLQGCNATGGSRFILHPNIMAAFAGTSACFFACAPPTTKTGTPTTWQGQASQGKIENIYLTSLGGLIPGTAGQNPRLISGFTIANYIFMQGVSMSAGAPIAIISPSGEFSAHRLNLQNFTLFGGNAWTGVVMQGQGQNSVEGSIFAFGGIAIAATCSSVTLCSFRDDYIVSTAQGIQSTAGANTIFVTGSFISVVGGNGSCGALCSSGTDTWQVYGNPLITTTTPAFPTISTGSAGLFDMSGNNVNNTGSSAFVFTGSGTILDRGANYGNFVSGTWSNFTGKYIPAASSLANSPFPTATNFGTAIGSTALIPNVPYTMPINISVTTRQITAGVSCAAGTNTATPTITYTQPGGTAGTISPTVLSISANGVLDSGAGATQTFSFTAKPGTAVNFSVASALASTGCSPTPQYAFDIRNW
jgi:hypothetical protein